MSSFPLSRVPSEDFAEDLEVTHEEHLRLSRGSSNRYGVAKRLTNLMPKRGRKTTSSRDAVSICSDNATTRSLAGEESVSQMSVVTNVTIASNVTVKASNKTERDSEKSAEEGTLKFRKRWSKLRGMMGGKNQTETSSSQQEGPYTIERQHSYSPGMAKKSHSSSSVGGAAEPGAGRSRTQSDDMRQKRVRSTPSSPTTSVANIAEQAILDQSIRGRMDGVDVLSLGPAHRIPQCPHDDSPGAGLVPLLPWEDFPPFSFTGQSTFLTPAQMVTNMLWSSCGRELPEVILDGFIPGSEDRWSVRIEERPSQQPQPTNNRSLLCGRMSPDPPPLQRNDTDECCDTSEDGSPRVPTRKLWPTLWGPEPAPVKVTTLETIDDDDPLLSLAAEHSVPIDLDENSFCVSERGHLATVNHFVSVALSMGRFQTALLVYDKLLKGIDFIEDDNLRFLKGSTLHNIGVVHMWEGEFEQALEYFHLAVQERTLRLPRDHPDIAVSTVRKGLAQFALGRYAEALFAMELALRMFTDDPIVRAKILNNIGVIHFLTKDFATALQSFTASLEIQRLWLERSVRRDSIIYDSSTTLNNMGKLYLEKSDYEHAYFVFEEAVLLQTSVFRKDHDLVLDNLTSLALTRVRTDHSKRSLQILQSCLRSQNTRFGRESGPSIETIGLMGYVYCKLESYDDALKCLSTVRKWQKANLPANHPSLQKTKETVKKIESILGKSCSVWI